MIILFFIFCLILCYTYQSRFNVLYVQSKINNKYYLVRQMKNSQDASDILATINQNIILLSNYAVKEFTLPPYNNYMKFLQQKSKHVKISENSFASKYTSYSVEKGEELVFCLRSKQHPETFYNFNLLMYVVIHEMAHIACPEYGHTPLFTNIFTKLVELAIRKNIYYKIDFKLNHLDYCGLLLTDSVV